ncbi:MAG: phospholipase D-like domain-containing protein [Candidatus Paceibacterota bacterium]
MLPKNKRFFSLFLAFGLLSCGQSVLAIQTSIIAPVEVHFAPYELITPFIVKEIKQATSTIHGSLYGITNKAVADALIERDRSGVEVKIGEDKLQSAGKYDLHRYLSSNGVEVVIKKTSALEHNKWLIIDNQVVLEGSFNYSNNAQSQDNSFIIFRSPQIASLFEQNFLKIMARDKYPVDPTIK